MEVCVSRFNNQTYNENKNYRERYGIPCIYSSPIKITPNILPYAKLIVIEMNNDTNTIEGFGIIKNNLDFKKNYKIYDDRNYNRYVYTSKYRIDRNNLTSYEIILITELENLVFKTSKHCKRGHGIQVIPKHIKNNIEFNYCKFLNQLYISRFNK
jgi:predicted small metal-binding protein